MARRLRIGVSVFFAVLTVTICWLWIRSYYWVDCVSVPRMAGTVRGTLYLNQMLDVPQGPSDEVIHATDHLIRIEIVSIPLGTKSVVPIGPRGTAIPFWAMVLPAVTGAVIPWIGQLGTRFSLRTLLIAVTFVATLLGLGAWLAS